MRPTISGQANRQFIWSRCAAGDPVSTSWISANSRQAAAGRKPILHDRPTVADEACPSHGRIFDSTAVADHRADHHAHPEPVPCPCSHLRGALRIGAALQVGRCRRRDQLRRLAAARRKNSVRHPRDSQRRHRRSEDRSRARRAHAAKSAVASAMRRTPMAPRRRSPWTTGSMPTPMPPTTATPRVALVGQKQRSTVRARNQGSHSPGRRWICRGSADMPRPVRR